MSNAIMLEQLDRMGSDDVAAIPIDQVEMLLEEIADLASFAKRLKAKLDAVLNTRFAGAANALRAEAGKCAGIVRIPVGERTIKAELPKEVTWDQEILADIADTIRNDWDRDPTEYITIKYTVDERKYEAWPSDLRQVFEPARTLDVGRQTFKIVPAQGA